jgi:hypothetical protein
MAVVFGLAWGTPGLLAACSPSSHTLPEHCGSSAPSEHCDEMQGTGEAVCVLHHANQDVRKANDPTPSVGGTVASGIRSEEPIVARAPSIVFSRRADHRAVRRHAHVGVWLE